MAAGCVATLPPLIGPSWVCDGTRLLSALDARGDVFVVQGRPVVIRADLLEQADAVTMAAFPDWVPFAGGDHVHLFIGGHCD